MELKRGQVWVETVIYTLIGLVIIAILLATALPQIEKAGDRNVIKQTLTAFSDIDSKITQVEQTPGNLGVVELRIAKGKLDINSINNTLVYTLEDTPLKLSELDQKIEEGGIILETKKYGSNFKIILTKDYSDSLNMTYNGQKNIKTFQAGTTPYKIQIENIGDNSIGGKTHLDFDVM